MPAPCICRRREALRDQQFDRGIGGGVFITATVIRAGLDVAWPQRGDEQTALALRAGSDVLRNVSYQLVSSSPVQELLADVAL